MYYLSANLQNLITTKLFDAFSILTSKQQKFSECDPVLIRQFWKNCSPIQSWSGQNWHQYWCSPIQSWSVLISATEATKLHQVGNVWRQLGFNSIRHSILQGKFTKLFRSILPHSFWTIHPLGDKTLISTHVCKPFYEKYSDCCKWKASH